MKLMKTFNFCGFLGSSSAHLQLLNAESRQYINNAIIMSGSALHHWALSPSDTHVEEAYVMSVKFDEEQYNFTGLIDFLQRMPSRSFLEALEIPTDSTVHVIFGPVIESKNSVFMFGAIFVDFMKKKRSISINISTHTQNVQFPFSSQNWPILIQQ